jgi:GTP pyrophosphokinase
MDLERMIKNNELEPLVRFGKESSLDDVFVSVGYGKLNPKELLTRAFPAKVPKPTATEVLPASRHPSPERKVSEPKKVSSSGILVHGIENVLINFARCCHPLPGEQVVGFITRGRGVTVHRASCPRALDLDPQRRVEVHWATEAETSRGHHAAFLRVTAQDKQGVLAEVTSAISACGANIQRAQIRVTPELTGILEFEMTLQSLTQLQAIIRKVESIPNILKVERMSTHRIAKI